MKSNHYTSASAKSFTSKIILASLFVLFISMHAFAQTTSGQTIRGTVKYLDDNQPVPGANIYLKSQTSVGTLSDADGQFQFPRPLKAGEIIVFTFLGLENTEYIVPEQTAGLITISMPTDTIQIVDEILVEGNEKPRTAARLLRKTKANR